jgi:hypothetical protein
MLGRVAVALLLALPAFPQCNFSLIESAQFRASQLDVAVDGFDLWTATSYGVSLYDRHFDPPRAVASIAVPGTTRAVRAANGTAYAGSGDKIAVVRKSGTKLTLVRTVDAGGTVNDLLLTTNYLYAATSNGIAQFDLLDASNPAKTTATFSTSSTSVLSLAVSGSSLYAADNDSSVEVFSITVPSLPQRTGTFTGRPRSSGVRATSGRIFVTDGAQTDIFTGSGSSLTKVNDLPAAFGTTSLTEPQPNVIFVAGPDLRLRALDVTVGGSPVELFTADLGATSGSVNRISGIASAANRVYVAAGDIGLLTYDTTSFTAPFPLHDYPIDSLTSVLADGDTLYVSRSSGGITRFTQHSGVATEGVSWDKSRSDVLRDTGGGFLQSSSGATMTMWSISSSIPAAVATAQLGGTIVDAVLAGTTGYAVLADRSVWSANFAEQVPSVKKLAFKARSIERSGSGIAVIDFDDEGKTTTVSYFASSFDAAPQSATVSGIATGGVALSGTTAAIATSAGITLIDFAAAAAQTVIPQSTGGIATQLVMRGSRLIKLTDNVAQVWDAATKKLLRQFALPADAASADLSADNSVAGVATSSGLTTININSNSQQPSLIGVQGGSAFYKKVLAAAGHVYLQDARGVDIFSNRLEYRSGVRPFGFVDAAAANGALFTITSDFKLASYTAEGTPLGTVPLAITGDARPLALNVVNGAVWVSIERGCLTGGCEQKTLIFDARSGAVQSAEFGGAIRDVVTSGARAYAVIDLPNEVRVYDVSDAFHPRQLASRAAEGTQRALSISFAGGTVYVLGEKLYAYAENDLSKIAEQFPAYFPDPSNPVTYVDQHVRIDGNCAAVTGRSFGAQLFNAATTTWSSTPTAASPSPARSIASVSGTIYVLTDHSLEIFAAQPFAAPSRRRTAR